MFKNKDVAAGWLAGIIDGEGHVANRNANRYIDIVNTDRDLIDGCKEALDLLGILTILNVKEIAIQTML